jgi:hypothetical protein
MSAINNLKKQRITKSIARMNVAGLLQISAQWKGIMKEEPSSSVP